MSDVRVPSSAIDAFRLPIGPTAGLPATTAFVADPAAAAPQPHTKDSVALATPQQATTSAGPSSPLATGANLLAATAMIPVAAPGVAAAGAQALQTLEALQAKGFQFERRRAFYIPFVMKRDVAVAPQDFLERLDAGSKRLQVSSPQVAAAPVQTRQDLDALDAFYLGGHLAALPQPALADALATLYVKGWRFTRPNHGDVGPYGAWKSITGGTAESDNLTAGDRGHAVSLREAEDAPRLRYFLADGVDAGLRHPAEAASLRALEARPARFWSGGNAQSMATDAQETYRKLFADASGTSSAGAAGSGSPTPSTWVGPKSGPLVAFSAANLADRPACERTYDAALKEYEKLTPTGLGGEQNNAWHLLQAPVAGETFDQRVAWMQALVGTQPHCPAYALKAFTLIAGALRPGESFDTALQDYVAVRACTGAYDHPTAASAFTALHDHLDETLPGPQPLTEKRKLFLELMEATKTVEGVASTWKALEGTAPAAERVAVYRDLLVLENGYQDRALQAFGAVTACCASGETLAHAAGDLKTLRSMVGKWDTSDGIAAFRFVREDLDASLPGPSTHDERRALYTSLLGTFHSHATTLDTWKFLTGETANTPPRPDAEFSQRVAALSTLHKAENDDIGRARTSYTAALACREPGESLPDLVAAFTAVRSKVGKWDTNGACAAFHFLRRELDTALAGPWKPDEKRAMYLKLLDATHSHGAALNQWKLLVGDTPPADLPQRVDTLLQLAALENDDLERGQKALAQVVAQQRPGEALAATAGDYAQLRGLMGTWDTDGGCAALAFARQELAASLPGPWTDAERRAMYEKLLSNTHSHGTALQQWQALSGVTKDHPAPSPTPDFPAVLDGFLALKAEELGDAERGMKALGEIRQAPTGALPDNVADYLAMRPMVGRWSTDEAVALFHHVHHELPGAQRASFLRVQEAAKNLEIARATFAELCATPTELDERIGILARRCQAENGDFKVARGQLAAMEAHRGGGESLAHLEQSFGAVRDCLKGWNGINGAVPAFAYLREKVPSSRDSRFLSILRAMGNTEATTQAWEILAGAGGDGTFERRVDAMVSQPPERWKTILGSLEKLEQKLPPGVDRDRAVIALLPLLGLRNADAAVDHVSQRLAGMAAADPATALEWQCGMMAAAGSVEAFDQGMSLVEMNGGAGTTEERRDLLQHLLEATRGSDGRLDAALGILARLERLDNADFAATAEQAEALAGAMKGHAADARAAIERILDDRAGGGPLSTIPLEEVVTRFATQYGVSGSVDNALARVKQEGMAGDLKVESTEDAVVIGGIRVARKKTAESPAP